MELLTQLFVTIFGVLFGKVVDNKNNTCQEDQRIIIEHIERVEVVHTIKDSSRTQNSGDEVWVIFFAIIAILYPFVKYQETISAALILSSVALEIMTMCIVYIVIKRGWRFGRDIQSLVIYNMIATVVGIAIIVQLEHPIFYAGYSALDVMKNIEVQGIVGVFFEQPNMIVFVVSQMVAILLLCFSMFSLLLSNISLWAMIRIIVTGKEKGFWNGVYNKLGSSCRKTKWYIKGSIGLLIMSFIFISGAFVSFFEWIKTL